MADPAAVTRPHDEYSKHTTLWQRLRDTVDGEDAVKERDRARIPRIGTLETGLENLREKKGAPSVNVYAGFYLPPLPGHTRATQYAAYLRRAKWYGATGRTLDALVGAVFRKPPTVEPAETEPLDEWLDSIDLASMEFTTFARWCLREVLQMGRVAILTDWSDEQDRPFLRGYTAESVLNWREEVRNGARTLTQAVLSEQVQEPAKSGIGVDVRQQYRVLTLEPDGLVVDVYRAQQAGGELVLATSTQPTQRGARVPYVPLVIVGPADLQPAIQKSPLLDLATLNCHHYCVGADYYSALYKLSCPQPWVVGGDPDKDVYEIGGGVWLLPDGAMTGMLEYTGAGVGSLREALEDDKAEMALLGARLLSPQKREAETAEAMRLQSAGEQAVLALAARTVAEALEQSLQWCAEWAGMESEEIEVWLNTDFDATRLSGEELLRYWELVQGGGISQDTFLTLLFENELIESVEDEKERLAAQGPLGLSGAPPDVAERLTAALDKIGTTMGNGSGAKSSGTELPDEMMDD